MRVVIVGGGDVGAELAGALTGQGKNEVTVIDVDQERCEQLSQELDVLVLHGDGTDPELLGEARVPEADALVAATGSDAINTVISMLGRRLEVGKLITRLEGVGLRAACREIGVDAIVSPKRSSAATMLSAIHGFHLLDFSMVARGGLSLVDVDLSKAAGTKVSELELPDGATIVAIVRGRDHALLARARLEIQEGDNALVLVESMDLVEGVEKAVSGELIG